MKLIQLLFTLITMQGVAQDIKFYISKSNNLVIKSNSCEDLLKERESICSLNKTKDYATKSCQRSKHGGYYISISSCLPKYIRENKSKKLYKDGTNCWGTAMYTSGLLDTPRFAWQKEIEYWQSSPVCEKINHKDDLKSGDIINVYGPEYIFDRNEITMGSKFEDAILPNKFLAPSIREGYSGYHNFLHSEVYVSKTISFGKESPNKLDKFQFKKLNEVYGRAKDVECQENQSLSPHKREYTNQPKDIRNSKCSYFTIAYSCKSINEYLADQHLNETNIEDLNIIKDLQLIQSELFKLQTLKNFYKSKTDIERLVTLADKVRLESLELLQDTKLNKPSEIIVAKKYFTAAGIRKTLEQAYLIPATELL
jgi:hypothetical protein